MTTFDEFINSIIADGNDGKAFERFCRPCQNNPPCLTSIGDLAYSAMPNPLSFRYFKTSPEIIQLAVMLYVRFPLSLRNVEDLLH